MLPKPIYILWTTFTLLVSGIILDKRQSENNDGTHFDYVILGGGTAGLVVASRLSENPAITVAVIEAGDFERNNPNVTNIKALGLAQKTRVDWQYDTAPQIYAGNETIIYSAGKGLGGSSLINGMTYMRAASSQLDLWPSLGLELDWETIFNYSKKGEHFQPPTPNLVALGAGYDTPDHGFDGPLKTCIGPYIVDTDIHDTFNTTFQELGVPPRYEFNGGELLGYGIQQACQDVAAGVRADAAHAYYYPVANRTNLVVMVNMTATDILWASKNGAGNLVASGAQISSQDGTISTIYADREVILSAGAMRSPGILEHSGIGNPTVLSRQNIDVKVNLPAVGENLQDQTTMAVVGASTGENTTGFLPFVSHVSLHDLFGSNTSSIYEATRAKLPQYAQTIASQNGNSSSAVIQEQLLRTQLELLFNSNTPTSEIVPAVISTIVGCIFWPLQPFSRGNVHINSTDKTAQPHIDPKFFQIDFDGLVSVATARWARKFLETAPVSSVVNISTIAPPIPFDAPDETWLDWVKTKSNFQPNYHHLGTCAMLPRASGGVVDNEFKVYGTENVRVVDLSVVPLQVAGHSMATLYGIAEWAAVKIQGSQ